jgi:cell division protein FtsB
VGVSFAIFVVAGISYFSYAALQGESGLFTLFQMQAKEKSLQKELSALRTERERMTNKTSRLSDGYLDLDLLDEQARKVLGMARGNEIIIR